MATTTIRIDDELKSRIAAAAEQAGKTPHAFMLDALAKTVQEAEQDAEFQRIAEERWEKFRETGLAVPAAEVETWARRKLRGEHPKPPRPRKLRA